MSKPTDTPGAVCRANTNFVITALCSSPPEHSAVAGPQPGTRATAARATRATAAGVHSTARAEGRVFSFDVMRAFSDGDRAEAVAHHAGTHAPAGGVHAHGAQHRERDLADVLARLRAVVDAGLDRAVGAAGK